MNRRSLLNIATIPLLLLALIGVTRFLRAKPPSYEPRNAFEAIYEPIERGITDDGRPAIRDARGKLVPIQRYQRIAAASTISAEVVRELIEEDRIVAYSQFAADHDHNGWKFQHKPGIATIQDIEDILALSPDIFFYNLEANATAIARLEERGVEVFDLGPMLGVPSFLKQAEEIMAVLDESERFEPYRYRFLRQLDTVQCRPIERPEQIMYVGMFGPSLFGGTKNTSYNDVIRRAGLIDIAEAQYSGWPEYTPESLLAIDPPWILTSTGMRNNLCSHGALRLLQACADNGKRIVELPDSLIGDAGSAVLTAASLLFDAVYGPCSAPGQPSP